MTPIKVGGSLLGILCGGWAAFLSRDAVQGPCAGCAPTLQQLLLLGLLAVGLLLVIDSLISLGFRAAFLGGAVLSAATLALLVILWSTLGPAQAVAGIVLAVATLAVDVVASRPSRALSEQVNPYNLPVFG